MPLWKLEDSVHIGHTIKPHGYLGKLKVAFSFSGFDELIEEGDYLFLLINQKPVPFLIEDIHWQTDDSALVKFADVDTDEEAARVKGLTIVLSKDLIPESVLEEMEGPNYYGYDVVDEAGHLLGKVEAIREDNLQPLLVIMNEGKEILLPIHQDIILDIDEEKGVITVSPPEGLLEL